MPEYILGVRAHDYGKGDVQEIFCNIKKDGWHCTQLALKKLVMGVTSYSDVTPDVIKEVKAALAASSLDVAVLGTYVELGSLDSAKRQKDVSDFVSQISVCKELNAGCMGSETTYLDSRCSLEIRDEAINTLLQSLETIMPEAERQGVTIALEPVWFHTMNTVENTKRVLDRIQSPNLKIIFDPGNLLSPEWVNKQEELYYKVMECWGEKIVAIHFKGLKDIEKGYNPCSLQESVVDYGVVFDVLKYLPQNKMPFLREEAIPKFAKQDQEYMRKCMGTWPEVEMFHD